MKKILTLALALIMTMAAVCAAAEDAVKKVYFCVSNLTHPFSEASVKDLNRKVEELGLDWEIIVSDGQGDANIQLTTIEDAINSGADAIIWKPVTSETASAAAAAIMEAGIPSINVNRGVTNGEVTCLIYGQNTQIGEFVAADMIERLGGEGKVAIIEGKLGSADSLDRKVLFEEAINAQEGMEIVADQAGNWSKDTAMSITEDILIRHPDLAAIYCQSDEMAQGAVLAVESAGLTGEVLIYGVDGYKSCFDMVAEGTMAATVIYPTSLGTAIEVLKGIFDNGGVYEGEEVIYDDVIIVTQENVEEYYDLALEA